MAYWLQSPQTFQEAFNIARQFEADRLLLHAVTAASVSAKQTTATVPKLMYQSQNQSPRLQRPQTSHVDQQLSTIQTGLSDIKHMTQMGANTQIIESNQ